MTKLIVTADIHGSYSAWLTVKTLLKPSDSLAIAGDLFDTRYGNYAHSDFKPEAIKKELALLKHPFYYAYGNCDTPSFLPGFHNTLAFSMFNKNIFLYHGDKTCPYANDIDIIIQGHTHLCHLEKKDNRIFMNPGSIASPRNGIYTYGLIDSRSANLIDLNTGEPLFSLYF